MREEGWDQAFWTCVGNVSVEDAGASESSSRVGLVSGCQPPAPSFEQSPGKLDPSPSRVALC